MCIYGWHYDRQKKFPHKTHGYNHGYVIFRVIHKLQEIKNKDINTDHTEYINLIFRTALSTYEYKFTEHT